jgi:formylglycine-generating enzyme required for sulfatase activity
MRKRFVLLMVALSAMVAALACRENRQAPPREFTSSVGMKFIWIDPGSFKMGSEHDGPVHQVTLSKGYYLQATEVTQAQWRALMETNPSAVKGPDRPVEMVSWDDIQEFLRKLNAREKGSRYRLPTEAEWEYACRAGGQEPDRAPNLGEVGWWGENSENSTHPVGQKKPNVWGLHDMRGNVWERVQGWEGAYSAQPQIDPQGPQSGDARMMRGGSALDTRDFTACSFRAIERPPARRFLVGFRCARTF